MCVAELLGSNIPHLWRNVVNDVTLLHSVKLQSIYISMPQTVVRLNQHQLIMLFALVIKKKYPLSQPISIQ